MGSLFYYKYYYLYSVLSNDLSTGSVNKEASSHFFNNASRVLVVNVNGDMIVSDNCSGQRKDIEVSMAISITIIYG